MSFSASFDHDERSVRPIRARFDALAADQIEQRTLAMPDPQQPDGWNDEAPVVMAGAQRMRRRSRCSFRQLPTPSRSRVTSSPTHG